MCQKTYQYALLSVASMSRDLTALKDPQAHAFCLFDDL